MVWLYWVFIKLSMVCIVWWLILLLVCVIVWFVRFSVLCILLLVVFVKIDSDLLLKFSCFWLRIWVSWLWIFDCDKVFKLNCK